MKKDVVTKDAVSAKDTTVTSTVAVKKDIKKAVVEKSIASEKVKKNSKK